MILNRSSSITITITTTTIIIIIVNTTTITIFKELHHLGLPSLYLCQNFI